MKRRETRWSCRSRVPKAPGEHFKTSLTPDKAKDFFTDCRTETAAVINEHWQDSVFRNTSSSVVSSFPYRHVVPLDHLDDAGHAQQQPASPRRPQAAAPLGIVSGVILVRNYIHAHFSSIFT